MLEHLPLLKSFANPSAFRTLVGMLEPADIETVLWAQGKFRTLVGMLELNHQFTILVDK